MNFTYYQKDELVIMCTKRDTKKFRQIIKSNTVALLIHDFPRAFASFLFLLFSLHLCVVVVVVVVVHLNLLNLNLISFFFNFFFQSNFISFHFGLSLPSSSDLKLDDEGSAAPPERRASSGRTYSITLNGAADVVTGEYAEMLRDVHLKANPEYAGFIQKSSTSTDECPSPAVFVVRIQSARLCNFKDKVVHWDARSASQSVSE